MHKKERCENCNCEEKIKVHFCPKCKSTKVKYIFELSNLFGVIPKQRCSDCGFELNTFPILITTKESFMKSNSSKKKKKKIRRKK